jgi:ATP-binding cassette, subfamily A (ABC1), member 3
MASKSGFDQARHLIGYCPQFDAIFERLTVREHLEFYANLKGISRDYIKPLIEK